MSNISRQIAVLAAVLVVSAFSLSGAFAQVPGGSLDSATITKYAAPLTIPPAMPKTGVRPGGIDYYEIAVRQFEKQVLPPAGGGQCNLWGGT